MNIILLWGVTLAYVGQSGIALHQAKFPEALILIGYVVANLGLIWSLSK